MSKTPSPTITDINQLTVVSLLDQFGSEVSTAIKFAEGFYLPYPERISKPFLKSDHSAEELKEYSKKFDEYPDKLKAYSKNKEEYISRQNSVNKIIELFIKEIAGFNALVPDEYKQKVWALAYEDGHHNGFYEIYIKLNDLVNIFS